MRQFPTHFRLGSNGVKLAPGYVAMLGYELGCNLGAAVAQARSLTKKYG